MGRPRGGSGEEVKREREWESSQEEVGKECKGSGEGEGDWERSEGLGREWGRSVKWAR